MCCSLVSDTPHEIIYSIYFLHKGKTNLLTYCILFWRMSVLNESQNAFQNK